LLRAIALDEANH
jgi:hypothetical protein